MIDIKTQEQLLKDMLNNIPAEYEKTAGFLTYDLTKTNAIEIAVIYQAIEQLINKVDVSHLNDEELSKYVFQRRGIERKEATNAKVILELTGTGTVNEGDLFSTPNNIQFASTEKKDITNNGTIQAECILPGKIGMVGANSITQFPITLQGFSAVNNPSASYDGFEAETDESLRQRYYDDLQRPPTSNNIYHFLMWAKEVVGVSDAKVFPTWNGNNSVKVIIIDENKEPASIDIVNNVQEHIDPKGEYDDINQTWSKWGKGYGKSAIGSYCIVESATGLTLDISANIIKESAYSNEEVKQNIQNNLIEYFKSIAFDNLVNYVSYNKIVSIILASNGVLDTNNALINNDTVNINIGNEQVAILGELVLGYV